MFFFRVCSQMNTFKDSLQMSSVTQSQRQQYLSTVGDYSRRMGKHTEVQGGWANT